MSYSEDESPVDVRKEHSNSEHSSRLNITTLFDLPPEILAQIITHMKNVKPLFYLSQSCKKLNEFIQTHGFQAFVKTRFPYIQVPVSHSQSFWRDAALGLTTLERNLDRKAFIAWSIMPRGDNHRNPKRHRAPFRAGQTMGFIPVLDSYETWYGGDWSSRKEVVAWGAGARLVMRVKFMGNKEKEFKVTVENGPIDFNVPKQRIRWAEYCDDAALEGRDDITSIMLLPQQGGEDTEQLIIGRASGGLFRISLSAAPSQDQAIYLATYETAGCVVRSTAGSINGKRLFAACLSDSSIALYPLDTPSTLIAPLGQITAAKPGSSDKIWSSSFLGQDRLVIGCGCSKQPIQVYDLARGRFTDKSLRSLTIDDDVISTRTDTHDLITDDPTSIYSLAPLPSASTAGGYDGDVFLSGAYDGMTRYVLSSNEQNRQTYTSPLVSMTCECRTLQLLSFVTPLTRSRRYIHFFLSEWKDSSLVVLDILSSKYLTYAVLGLDFITPQM